MSKKKKEPSTKTIKLLWGRSGNKCATCKNAIPEEGKEGNPFPVGVLMNIHTDIVPYNDFSEKFRNEFDRFVCTKFTDATDDGGLLGFRF